MPKSNTGLYQFICQQETRPEVGMKLSSLLISPVQRIPRYLLLLKELRALTPDTTFAHTQLKGEYPRLSYTIMDYEANTSNIL